MMCDETESDPGPGLVLRGPRGSRADRVSQRRTDVDLVRFLALASMYVAHVAPVPGPAHVLELSEYLTMPLFALLVGVGAQLGVWAAGPATRRWWWSMAVRATVLVGLGLVLDLAGAQVVIVLVHLGVLVLVAGPLARLPLAAVVAVAVAAFVVGGTPSSRPLRVGRRPLPPALHGRLRRGRHPPPGALVVARGAGTIRGASAGRRLRSAGPRCGHA